MGRSLKKGPFIDTPLRFEALDTPWIIMAEGADDFEDADWFIHVQQWTVPAYQRNRRFDQDETILRGCGSEQRPERT